MTRPPSRARVGTLAVAVGMAVLACSGTEETRLDGRISFLGQMAPGATSRSVVVRGTAMGDVWFDPTNTTPITLRDELGRRRAGIADLRVGDSATLLTPRNGPIQPSLPPVITVLRLDVTRPTPVDTLFFSPSVIPSTMDITVGSVVQFRVSPADRYTWEWRVSDTAVAWVHPDSGRVVAKKAGQAVIIVRATSEPRVEGAAVLRVR